MLVHVAWLRRVPDVPNVPGVCACRCNVSGVRLRRCLVDVPGEKLPANLKEYLATVVSPEVGRLGFTLDFEMGLPGPAWWHGGQLRLASGCCATMHAPTVCAAPLHRSPPPPQVPVELRDAFLHALDHSPIRTMQNKQLPAKPLHQPGAHARALRACGGAGRRCQ